MTQAKNRRKPVRQLIRINVLRAFGALVVIPLLVLTRPMASEGALRDILSLLGTLLVVAAVLGRFWAILYIGARKNKEVMQLGPYSVCRHPLYLSSTLGVAGFGLLLGSMTVAVFLTVTVLVILSLTAAREEAYLRQEFGRAYDDYAARVPRILPRSSLFTTPAQITVDIRPLAVTWADALVFLGFLPLALAVDWLRAAAWLPMLALP